MSDGSSRIVLVSDIEDEEISDVLGVEVVEDIGISSSESTVCDVDFGVDGSDCGEKRELNREVVDGDSDIVLRDEGIMLEDVEIVGTVRDATDISEVGDEFAARVDNKVGRDDEI